MDFWRSNNGERAVFARAGPVTITTKHNFPQRHAIDDLKTGAERLHESPSGWRGENAKQRVLTQTVQGAGGCMAGALPIPLSASFDC